MRRRWLNIRSENFSATLKFDAHFILPSSAQTAENLSLRPISSDYGTLYAAIMAQLVEDAVDHEVFCPVTEDSAEILAAFATCFNLGEAQRLLVEATTLCRALKAGCTAGMSSLLSENA